MSASGGALLAGLTSETLQTVASAVRPRNTPGRSLSGGTGRRVRGMRRAIQAMVRSLTLVLVFLAVLSSRPARADVSTPAPAPTDLRLPVAEAERPLTPPRLILGSDFSFDVRHNGHTFADLGLDLAFGITDNLTVRALVLPLQLAGPPGDGFHYGQSAGTRGPSVGVSYRLVGRTVEVALGVDARVFTSVDVSGYAIIPDAQLRIHATRRLRLDAQVDVHLGHGTIGTPVPEGVSSPGDYSLQAPVDVLYSFTDVFHAGIESGVDINDLQNLHSTVAAPLGVVVGATVPGKNGPLVDIDPYCAFTSVTSLGIVVGVNLTGFLYY